MTQKYYSNMLLLGVVEASGLMCKECGEIFEKPILTKISSDGFSRTYYACPRCLTNVKGTISPGVEMEGGCPHFFGFLKRRPKSMPIPDKCLTCKRMIECLI